MSLRIYLSGSIKKGRTDPRPADSFWTEADEALILSRIAGPVELLNPAKTDIRRNDYFVNYGCDLYLVQTSDVVLVDLRVEKGIGVGAELMFAHLSKRPVIGWLPPNSYYRREFVEDVFGEDLVNWIHPFVFGLCDHVADSLSEACDIIETVTASGGASQNNSKSPDDAIARFLEAYPSFDLNK